MAIGAVDWETLEQAELWRGTIAAIAREGAAFSATLASAKAALAIDPVPRSSPGCRAGFCGPGCTLSPARFTHRAVVGGVDGGRVILAGLDRAPFAEGSLRWLDGPLAGLSATILAADDMGLLLDSDPGVIASGTRVLLREGCDHTIATCAGRFDNAVNFQGEPFLPGTDLLAHYPQPR